MRLRAPLVRLLSCLVRGASLVGGCASRPVPADREVHWREIKYHAQRKEIAGPVVVEQTRMVATLSAAASQPGALYREPERIEFKFPAKFKSYWIEQLDALGQEHVEKD